MWEDCGKQVVCLVSTFDNKMALEEFLSYWATQLVEEKVENAKGV